MTPRAEQWLAFSKNMLQQLLPMDIEFEDLFGQRLEPARFAAMVERELPSVGHVLLAMSHASGESEVKSLFAQLSRDTVIVLFSSWANCMEHWRHLAERNQPGPWDQTYTGLFWQAVFQALAIEVRQSAFYPGADETHSAIH